MPSYNEPKEATVPDSTLIYISLGGNIDPERHLPAACSELSLQLDQPTISPIYQSPAVGMDGADFLNNVVGGHTCLAVEDVFSLLKDVEDAHGRIRLSNKFSDRTLDLDLLIFGDTIRQTTSRDADFSMTLPHPEITEQAYVIQPLSDIAPDFKHPISGLTFATICQQMKTQSPAKFNVLNQIML